MSETRNPSAEATALRLDATPRFSDGQNAVIVD
jgi:hypothetical protein